MRILYLGEDHGTSLQRSLALGRLGHSIRLINPAELLPNAELVHRWNYKTGGIFLTEKITKKILSSTRDDNYDLVWINGGELISPSLVKSLRDRFGYVLNYNNDDPFGFRDGLRWRQYLASVPEYNLLVVMRECNVAEARQRQARDVLRVFMSADEIAHARREIAPAEEAHWASQISFIGTWLPERGPILAALIRRQVPIAIYGDRWEKAAEWNLLKPFWRGPGLFDQDSYVVALQCSKMCLGLLSKENRDLHTTRSMEIPFVGSLLLAERTSEHLALYAEDREAVFWSNAEECARKCMALLADPSRREKIAAAGHARAIANQNLNEPVLRNILSRQRDRVGRPVGGSSAAAPPYLRILYVGEDEGTSQHRIRALARLGHSVDVLDPTRLFPASNLLRRWSFKTGGLFLGNYTKSRVLSRAKATPYDVVWVNGGELIGAAAVRSLRQLGAKIINYNNDDPLGDRDGRRWRLYREALPFYDLVVVRRVINIEEATKALARGVLHVFMSADEIAHAPTVMTDSERAKWKSEVSFVGTWMPERGPFMRRLVQRGIPLAIYGNNWQKAPEWPALKPFWRGPGLYSGDDYAMAIQASKVCLGLLSKGNRDLHTRRSVEIPYLGSTLLAERTSEHQALYTEGKEAVFWSDVEECADRCMALLANDQERVAIAAAGRARSIQNGYLNEPTLRRILDRVFS